MNIKKLCLALSITAIFGLVACGDDSSSSSTSGDDKSSSKGDDSSSEDGSNSGELNDDGSPVYQHFSGCNFTKDDDVWEYSFDTRQVLDEYNDSKKGFSTTYKITKDSIIVTQVETDKNRSKSYCIDIAKMAWCEHWDEENERSYADDECASDFEKGKRVETMNTGYGLVTYAQCTDEGEVSITENHYKNSSEKLNSLFEDAMSDCLSFEEAATGKQSSKKDDSESDEEGSESDDEAFGEGESDGDSFSESESAPEMEFVDGED